MLYKSLILVVLYYDSSRKQMNYSFKMCDALLIKIWFYIWAKLTYSDRIQTRVSLLGIFFKLFSVYFFLSCYFILINFFFSFLSFFLFFLFVVPCSTWHLSSPTRDRTHAPLHWKHGVLTTGPPGKSAFGDINWQGPEGDVWGLEKFFKRWFEMWLRGV